MTAIPFVRDFPFVRGAPERLSPLVRRVIADNPGPFTFTGTGTYLIGDTSVAIVDPGPDDPGHLGALEAAVAGAPVVAVLVTHTHRDHCAGARRLADRLGAPILAFGPHPRTPEEDAPALDEGGDPEFRPDRRIGEGDRIEGDGWTLTALHTPGHLSNHLCFALEEERALFVGDHVMGWATTVVAPPDGSMADYMASLERLLARDDVVYYPTHGAPIRAPQDFVRAVRAHRRNRDRQILERLAAGDTRIPEITRAIYTDIDKRLIPAAALNVQAHLIGLVASGAAVCDGAGGLGDAYGLAPGARQG